MGGRVIFQSFAGLSGALLTASSFVEVHPPRRLRDPSPSAKWRSATGWNIVAGFNDKIDITEGSTGDATATLTPGNYATGDLLATEIATQLNAAATDNTWTCTYSSTTFKFTIGHDNVATGGLEWSTGASAATSVGKCLGFDVSADDTGATSYAADNVSYHSREFVLIQTQSAVTATFGAVYDHNFESGATVTLAGNSSDSWASPGVSATLAAATGETPSRTKFFASSSYAFWRVVIEDVGNVDGYSEFGVLHVSNYIEPTYDFRAQWGEDREELSEIGMADQGAHWQNEKPTRRLWPITWPALSESEKTNSFDPWLNFVRNGRPFFFAFEPDSDETFVRYVILGKGGVYARIPGASKYQLKVDLMEVLG